MLVVFLLGLCLGSFANVLIDRLPRGLDVIGGRSRCDRCKKTLRWFELIPLLSFFMQRGRCLRCHKPISIQYPLVELITAIGLLYMYIYYSYSLPLVVAYSLIFFSLLVIFVADGKYQIIPDSMIVAGVIGVVMKGMSHIGTTSLMADVQNRLLSGLGASVFFLLLWRITRGRGMGLGDVKLAFLIGLFLGYPLTVVSLYLAFLTGAVVGVILMIAGQKSLKSRIAFGPFLVAACVEVFLWSEVFLSLWKRL